MILNWCLRLSWILYYIFIIFISYPKFYFDSNHLRIVLMDHNYKQIHIGWGPSVMRNSFSKRVRVAFLEIFAFIKGRMNKRPTWVLSVSLPVRSNFLPPRQPITPRCHTGPCRLTNAWRLFHRPLPSSIAQLTFWSQGGRAVGWFLAAELHLILPPWEWEMMESAPWIIS